MKSLRANSKLHIDRVYKIKNPARKFICALCTTPREVYYSKNLSHKNYFQIATLSLFLFWALWPFVGVKGLNIFFLVWGVVELTNKILYRREIACPHCGFDATWYRKNVKVARKKVEEFWQKKNSNAISSEEKVLGELASDFTNSKTESPVVSSSNDIGNDNESLTT